MSLRFARAAAATALAAGLASCTVWKKPAVAFEGMALHGLNPDGAALEVRLRVENPNSYRVVVRHFRYRLRIGKDPVGGGEADSDVAIEAKSASDVALPVSLDWRGLKERGFEFLFSGGVDYSIEGEIVFSTPIGTYRRPYEHSGRVSPFNR